MQNHNENLRILHTIYSNTLQHLTSVPLTSVPLTPVTTSIPDIKTPLYPHQSTLIHGMHNYRAKMTEGLQVDADEIKAKIGIVTDPSGSGKTLAILGYLASDTDPHPSFELTQYSTPYFYSQKQTYPQLCTNLIIVPSHLFGHWEDEIKTHTTLSYVPIETRGKIKENLIERIITSKFILTTNKCYRYVNEYALKHNITWNNICMDEPLFIQMKSSDPQMQFQFLWFISYQWSSLLFRNPLKKSQLLFLQEPMHSDLEEMLLDNTTEENHIFPSHYIKQYLSYSHPDRGYTIIRNSNEYIRQSIYKRQIDHTILQCKSTTTLQSLSSIYLARNTPIRSSNIIQLFQALGVESVDPNDYIASQEKQDMISRKIEENECGICLDRCEYPTIVKCCYHLYCAKCILQNTIIQFKCPTCRNALDVTHMHCLSPLGMNALRSKKDACLDVIQSKKSCIVYISFDKIYHDLWPELKARGITSELITSFSLRKAIKHFKEGSISVLFISKVELVRSLSVFTPCLLFYHDLPVFEQKQALIHFSHALRPLQNSQQSLQQAPQLQNSQLQSLQQAPQKQELQNSVILPLQSSVIPLQNLQVIYLHSEIQV